MRYFYVRVPCELTCETSVCVHVNLDYISILTLLYYLDYYNYVYYSGLIFTLLSIRQF